MHEFDDVLGQASFAQLSPHSLLGQVFGQLVCCGVLQWHYSCQDDRIGLRMLDGEKFEVSF
jgi:hypothetical protein